MKRILKIAAVGLCLLLVSLSACSLSSGPINGQVLEEGTGKPIPDAIVVVTWRGEWWQMVESSTACYHVETARTDAEGKYHIPAWFLPWEWNHLRVFGKETFYDAYKPGYTRPVNLGNKYDQPERVLLAKFKGAKEEYFKNLLYTTDCAGGGESRKNLYRLYATLAEEAQAIAETPDQKKRVEWLVLQAESTLVNETKPTADNKQGWTVNVDPNDSYKKEDLLK